MQNNSIFHHLGNYHTFEEFQKEISTLQSIASSNILLNKQDACSTLTKDISHNKLLFRSITIGKTVQGNSIDAIEITANKNAPTEVLFMSLFHGIEFIGVEMSLALMKTLVEGFQKNDLIAKVLEKTKIWFIPIVNVDTYKEVVESLQRFGIAWHRKNVNGVDLNRNFSVGFGTKFFLKSFAGEKIFKLMQFYSGDKPFSEPETRTIRDFAKKHKFKTSITFHSFGNLILLPYGHTVKKPKHFAKFLELAYEMRKRQKVKYTVIQGSSVYFCCGCEDDWLYDEFGTFAFTFELGKWQPFNFKYPLNIFNPFAMFNSPYIENVTTNNLNSCIYLIDTASQL